MLTVALWWLAVQVVALAALPITMRLLRFLPDRGLGLARPVGLLLVSYAFWLLATLGFLQNTTASVVAVVVALAVASALVWRREGREALRTLRRRGRDLLIPETLFLAGLAGWAFFRAHNPEIAYTEKPMEFGFLNAILRSPAFPPRDPWLSGFAISYYYLGYVVMAVLTRLTGLPSAVTFNLTGATLFALTLSGAYSLVWNMVQAHRERAATRAGGGESPELPGSAGARLAGLLGGLFVALMGNLEGVFEIVRANGWGSQALWRWLDVRGLGQTPPSTTWYPDDGWWWWRASRVIHDRDPLGNSMEVIDEFPFFSFLLGDNHPHVLALPFILLALGLALNVLLSRPDGGEPRSWLGRLTAGLWEGWELDVPLWGLFLGALAFLNTWDYPIYLGILVLAYAARRRALRAGEGWGWLSDGATLALVLGGLGVALYLPFYLGFRSQAGGLGLVDVRTRPHQYLLMFGTQIVLVMGFLAAVGARALRGTRRVPPLGIALGGAMALAAVAALALGWWTAGGVLALAGVAGALLVWAAEARDGDAGTASPVEGIAARGSLGSPALVLALLMVLAGLLLTAAVEVVFLRDTFGTRMNTVFKFYYQGWVLLSLAGAYGVYHVLAAQPAGAAPEDALARGLRSAWVVGAAALVLAGSSYTVAATVSKAGAFRGEPTLDGTAYVARARPHEQEAIDWLRESAGRDAVILEAPGEQYTEYNWISAATGIPTVLGWAGHEAQWRGSYEEPALREPAIATVYGGGDPASVAGVLEEYGIDYVVVGPNERAKYGVGPAALRTLDRLLVRVYENERLVIYGRRG